MFDTFIRFQAEHRPHAPAIVRTGGDISYTLLDQMVDRVGTALKREGAAQAGLAAVRLSDPLRTWLVLFALARLGVGTLSFAQDGDFAALEAVRADLVILDGPADPGPAGAISRLHLSPEWFSASLEAPATPLPSLRLDPDAVGRVILSSGTTGRRKAIARSWAELTAAVAQRQVIGAAYRRSVHGPMRMLLLMGVDTGAFFQVLSVWAGGGALVLASREALRRDGALQVLAPNYLAASPLQLQQLVADLPADFTPLPELVIGTGGSHLPPPVREAIRRRLAPTIWNEYGSSEAGTVAMADTRRLAHSPAAAGWAPPGVALEIVGADDTVLPPGHDGIIRMRSTVLAAGYLHDAASTAEFFRAGWFYPGDVGSLDENGLLYVKGRVSELMNFGGVKVLPALVEDAARACSGVRDVAAFSAQDEAGGEKPWLAVVRGENFDEAALVEALAPLKLPAIFLAWMDQIPRNDRGKIERDRLRQAARRPLGG